MSPADLSVVSVLYTVLVLLDSSFKNDTRLAVYTTVETENGAVRGKLERTFLQNMPYYAFKGIPYAKPPIGELRFKATEPVDSWKPRILDASEYGSPCIMSVPNFDIKGQIDENCLNMNIYVPAINTTSKFAVMVHIVGGGFRSNPADDSLAGPDFLVEHGIILVSFNYRLGVFGFMNLDTPEYSGNMGMKDQQMAMQWVHKNIEHFGGDPNKITLSGHSTGGMSVGYHVLNSESRKYFQRAIPMSNSALNYNAYHDGNHKCLMYAIAKNASHPVNNTKDLIKVLQSVPAKQIQSFIENKFELPNLLSWAPTVERKDAVRPFLTDVPTKAFYKMQHFNISSLFTFTNGEYLLFETADTLRPDIVDKHIKELDFQLPIHEFNLTYAKKPYLRELLEEVRDYFINNATTDSEKVYRYVNLKSYVGFVYGVEKSLEYHLKKSDQPSYLMRFSAQGTMRGFKGAARYATPVHEAGHAEELCYVFKCNAYQFDYDFITRTKNTNPNTTISLNIIRYLTTLYSNFVKYGDPAFGGDLIEGYKPVRPSEKNFLDVTNDGLVLGQSPNGATVFFMDYIVAKGIRLLRDNERDPPTPEFDLACQKLKNKL